MHRLLGRKDIVNSIGNYIHVIMMTVIKIGFGILYFLKFIIYDITVVLCKLPFGNYIGVIYCIFVAFLLKNAMNHGEFTRVLFRSIDLYFIRHTPFVECLRMFRLYILRGFKTNMRSLWECTGVPLKRRATKLATEFILEHSEQIERSVTELAKTAVFATIVSSVSRELMSQLGPVAIDAFAKSDMARTIFDIQQNTGRIDTVLDTMQMQMKSSASHQSNIEYAVQSLTDNLNYVSMNMENEPYLIENIATFNQKLTEISMQIEYLRMNQPSQLREILSTISLSSLALNDIALPSVVSNVFTRIMDVGSSASQQGRRRIEN